MAFIPVPRGIKLTMQFIIQGKLVNVTFGFEVPGSTVTTTDLTNATSTAATWWDTTMKNHFSNQTGLTQVTAYDLTSSSAPVDVLPVSPTNFGTTTDAPVPANVALVTSPRTINRGRSSRGREYWPGFAKGQLTDDSHVDNTFVTNLTAAMTAFQTAMGALGLVWSVISRFTGHAPRIAGILTPVTGTVVNTRIDTQKRRLQ